jgi:hypothetical protein
MGPPSYSYARHILANFFENILVILSLAFSLSNEVELIARLRLGTSLILSRFGSRRNLVISVFIDYDIGEYGRG